METHLAQTLEDLERAISALLAHELHGGISPEYRDLHEQVMKARAAMEWRHDLIRYLGGDPGSNQTRSAR
jgi:hypothetical protein